MTTKDRTILISVLKELLDFYKNHSNVKMYELIELKLKHQLELI